MKRQPKMTSKTRLPPAKRPHLTQTETQAGPPRRSARLHARQISIDQTSSLDPCHRTQITAGTKSALKRAALSQESIQQFDVDQQKPPRAAKNTRQSKPLKRPYSSLSKPKVECEDQFYPATLLWKRYDSNNEGEHQPKRTRLTREALALFNKMGAKKGKKAAAPASLATTVASSTTKTTSTTMAGFAMQAMENGILKPHQSKPPVNLGDIQERYALSRGTASPTESMYRDYINTVGKNPNEATTTFEFGGQLMKRYPNENYDLAINRVFTGLPEDVGFNKGLSAPQPDFVEGLTMEEFRSVPNVGQINGAILYKDVTSSVILPHLAGEFKKPGKDMEQARLQSAYDGAALVSGRNQALNSIGEPSTAGHAKITTFTTDGANLNLFAHYATPSEDGTAKYHQYYISSTNLTSSHENFREGYRQIRNAQDHAREESYKLRDQLKENWETRKSQPAPLPSIEDEDDYQVIDREPICQPTPPMPSGPRHGKASVTRSSHSTEASSPSAADVASGRGHQHSGLRRSPRGHARE
ncbi:hypothetical protein LCI18_001894 [Fusarium solani-melongenae]|uniref:Uncharacterized protein n=1 Tax=Fusarium solani subsp. cucurbitae TaxID=2747967 RepID=A0ACD3YPS8_FUSSC|nr:hypothetical protein LCI18_001894 [Fusarium solani-melongenae]